MILLDEFYKDLYMDIFKKWICLQKSPNYRIKEYKDIVQIESSYGIAEVTFNLYYIIELKVTSKKRKELDFYLHFQMNTLKHAVSLFNEMITCLLKLDYEAKTKVLLCCSGGLTTSYFAQEINKASKLLKNTIEVSAVGYNQLYQIGQQFDFIFLALQISYLHAQVQSILKDQVVMKIPPLVFARYDVGTLLKMIENSKSKKIMHVQEKENDLKLDIKNKQQIACLTIFKNKERIHIAYRIYVQGKVLFQNETIKYKIHIQDIYDLLDTLIIQYPKLSTISLSLPGIVDAGKVTSTYISGVENENIEEKLKRRYKQSIKLYNDIYKKVDKVINQLILCAQNIEQRKRLIHLIFYNEYQIEDVESFVRFYYKLAFTKNNYCSNLMGRKSYTEKTNMKNSKIEQEILDKRDIELFISNFNGDSITYEEVKNIANNLYMKNNWII